MVAARPSGARLVPGWRPPQSSVVVRPPRREAEAEVETFAPRRLHLSTYISKQFVSAVISNHSVTVGF